jgi:flagellar biosynthesis GTPase FlhF
MIASNIEHLEDSVIVNIVVRMPSIFVDLHLPKVEDFEELPQAVVDHLKRKEEAKEIAERCYITAIRKRNPLLHVMAELRINKTLITLGNLLVSSFLHSFILSMRKETREHVIERINVFDIGDDSNFDIKSLQNLVFQTNYMLTFLDEHNDKETFFGIFRLYKRNLYRFWYRIGMTLRYNLDYHWKKIMRDSCKTAEEEEMKKAMDEEMKKVSVDNAQKQLEEGIEQLKKKSISKKSTSSNSKKKRRKICRVEEPEKPEEPEEQPEEEDEDAAAVEEEEQERRAKEEEERKAKEERAKEEEVVIHTCGFATTTQYVKEPLKILLEKNQEMRCVMNDTYFAYLASPDTIFV